MHQNTFLLVFFFIINSCLYSQSFELKILFLDVDSNQLDKRIELPTKVYQDSLSLTQSLVHFIDELHQYGYHEASVDTIVRKESVYFAFIHLGLAYKWANLDGSKVPDQWLGRTGFRERLFQQKNLNIEEWQALQKKLARQAADNGFPFARVFLDSIVWQEQGQIHACIQIQKGKLVFFEKLIIEGELDISIRYLEQYLGFIPGEVYNETVILNAQQRLQDLAFVQLLAPPKVQFIGNQVRLILNLAPKKASRFDFIVGVLPNSKQTGKLLITGQLEAELQNTFGKGEQIKLAFIQARAQTQSLNIAFQYPYIFELPFGVETQLDLYKRDTNYLDFNWRLGIQYLLKGDNQIQAFWSNKQTSVLGVDSSHLVQNQALPDTLDVSRQSFGLGLVYRNVDYRYNPRKGWEVSMRLSAGQKQIHKNSQIENLGFSSLYDDLRLKSAQYRFEFIVSKFQSLGKRSVLKLGLQAAAILGQEPVLVNEQFRIGGNKILRGFDEESIFASNFALFTTEYRFLLSTHSYFYVFFDLARIDNQALGTITGLSTIDWPQGIGTGITFETKSGLFGLNLAFGRQAEQAFDFGAPKVHFGYVSLF